MEFHYKNYVGKLEDKAEATILPHHPENCDNNGNRENNTVCEANRKSIINQGCSFQTLGEIYLHRKDRNGIIYLDEDGNKWHIALIYLPLTHHGNI